MRFHAPQWLWCLLAATISRSVPAVDEYSINHSDYDNVTTIWGISDRYEVYQKIGSGKYCSAFLGLDKVTNSTCVIKALKPIKLPRLQREIRVLQLVSGGPNIVKLIDTVIDPLTKTPALVFEHCPGDDYKKLYHTLNSDDIQYYIYQIVRALAYVHGKGIMHRDIKPQNIMINHRTRDVRLIDFGLGEFYHPGQKYNRHVATRYFKGPELLVRDYRYDYRLDMWSLGCVLAGMLFGKDHFFNGRDDDDMVVRIVKVLGSDDFNDYLQKHNLKIEEKLAHKLDKLHKHRQPWSKFMPPAHTTAGSGDKFSVEALDFLDRLLRYDFRERMSSEEALHHPYLAPIHKQQQQQQQEER